MFFYRQSVAAHNSIEAVAAIQHFGGGAAMARPTVSFADLPAELLAYVWSFLPLRELVRAGRISRAFADIPVFFWARLRPDRVLAELADERMPDEVCARLAAACAGLPCVDPVEAAAAQIEFADEAVRDVAGAAHATVARHLIIAAVNRLNNEYARVFRRPALAELAAADPSFRFWWLSGAQSAMIAHRLPALLPLVCAHDHFVPNRRRFDEYVSAGEAVFRGLAEHFPAEFADWMRACSNGPEFYYDWSLSGVHWLFTQFQQTLGCPLPPSFSAWVQSCFRRAARHGEKACDWHEKSYALDVAVAFAREYGEFDAIFALGFDWAEVVAGTKTGPPRVYLIDFGPNSYYAARRVQMLAELCTREPRPGIIAEFSQEFAADAAHWAAVALLSCSPVQRAALCRALNVSARIGAADLRWLLQHRSSADSASVYCSRTFGLQTAQSAQTAQTARNVCEYLSEFDGDATAALRAWLAADAHSWVETPALAAAAAYCGLVGAPVRVAAYLVVQPQLAHACGWCARLLENCNELVATGLAKGQPVHWLMLTSLKLGLAGLTTPNLRKLFRARHAWRFRWLVENTTEPLDARVLVCLARVVNELDYSVFLALLALVDKRCLEPAAGAAETLADTAAGAAGLEDAIVATIAHGAGSRARTLLTAWPGALSPARACRLFLRAVGRQNPAVLRALCGCNGAGFVPGPALGTYARAVVRSPAMVAALDELCIGPGEIRARPSGARQVIPRI